MKRLTRRGRVPATAVQCAVSERRAAGQRWGSAGCDLLVLCGSEPPPEQNLVRSMHHITFVCYLWVALYIQSLPICMRLHSDLQWSQRRPDGGSGRGWRSWRAQLPPETPRREGREQLITPHWGRRQRDGWKVYLISFQFLHLYTFQVKKCIFLFFESAYLLVREYRYDPSEDTATHQTAAVTIACPDGLPEM